MSIFLMERVNNTKLFFFSDHWLATHFFLPHHWRKSSSSDAKTYRNGTGQSWFLLKARFHRRSWRQSGQMRYIYHDLGHRAGIGDLVESLGTRRVERITRMGQIPRRYIEKRGNGGMDKLSRAWGCRFVGIWEISQNRVDVHVIQTADGRWQRQGKRRVQRGRTRALPPESITSESRFWLNPCLVISSVNKTVAAVSVFISPFRLTYCCQSPTSSPRCPLTRQGSMIICLFHHQFLSPSKSLLHHKTFSCD